MQNSQQDNFVKQAPVALLAIAQHMVDHDLPAPWSIDIAEREQAIRIRTLGVHHQAWLNTVELLEEHNEPADRHPSGWLRSAWSLRLPVGVVFDLVTFREQPMLTVVPA